MPLSPRTLRPSSTFTPKSISGLALWLDGSDANSLYTTDAGAVTAVTAPTEISGCVGWWDSADLSSMRQNSDGTGTVAAGDPVGWWKDKSATGANVTGSGSARPTLSATGFNSKQALAFNGSSTNLSNASYTALNSLSGFTVIAVCANSGGTANLSRVYPAGFQGFWMNGGRRCYVDDSANYALTGTPGSNVLAAGIYSFRFASSAIESYESGSLNTPTIIGTIPSSTGSSASAAIHIGSNIGANSFWNGPIAEYILFNRALTRTELARVEAYLAAKWGISGVHRSAAQEIAAVGAPTELAGCALWLDGGDASTLRQNSDGTGAVTSANDPIGYWASKAGTLAATQTSTSRPSLSAVQQNGRNVITFDGVNDNFSFPDTSLQTVFAVCLAQQPSGKNTDSLVGYRNPLNSQDGSNNIGIRRTGTPATGYSHPGNAGDFSNPAGSQFLVNGVSTTLVGDGVWHIVTAIRGTSGLVCNNIGAHFQGREWGGRIAEIVGYSGVLSATDRARVEKYLANKWGIANVPDPAPPVGYWMDRSGNGRHATQSTAANRPTISATAQNGRKALAFDGSNGWMRTERTTYAARSVFTVFRRTGTVAIYSSPFAKQSTVAAGYGGSSYAVAYGNEGGWSVVGSGTGRMNYASNGSPHKLSAAYMRGAAMPLADAQNYLAGIPAAPNTTDAELLYAEAATDTDGNQAWFLGTEPFATTRKYPANILEVLIYNRAITAAERQRLERYLAARWGITLAPQVSNADAQNWIDRVYANGGTVSSATASAVNAFCNAIDAAGIRDRFYRMGIFAGSNLNAALVPLYRGPSLGGTQYGNTTDTNNAFVGVGTDYAETGASGGLTGNGTSKYLNTGFPTNTLADGNRHLAAYAATWPNAAYNAMLGSESTAGISSQFTLGHGAAADKNSFGCFSNTSRVQSSVISGGAFWIGVNDAAGSAKLYRNGSQDGSTVLSASTPTASNVFVFAINRASSSSATDLFNGRLSGYSIGLSMTASQAAAFYTAMQAFQTAMGRQV